MPRSCKSMRKTKSTKGRKHKASAKGKRKASQKRKSTKARKPSGASFKMYVFKGATAKGNASHKYWAISRRGTAVTTKYGAIGAPPRLTTKSFANAGAAVKAAAALVRQKVHKGYVRSSK